MSTFLILPDCSRLSSIKVQKLNFGQNKTLRPGLNSWNDGEGGCKAGLPSEPTWRLAGSGEAGALALHAASGPMGPMARFSLRLGNRDRLNDGSVRSLIRTSAGPERGRGVPCIVLLSGARLHGHPWPMGRTHRQHL